MSGSDLPLHVETHGLDAGPSVPTFLLLHGYAASTFTWRYWAPRLAERGHVVLVDMKGHGSAPKPDDGRYGPEHQAELIQRLVLERDLRDLTLVGHSLGGAVALLTASRLLDDAEGRLERLIIVAGAAYEQRLPPFVWLAHRPLLSRLLVGLLGPSFVIRHVLRSIVFDPASVREEQVQAYAKPLYAAGALQALITSARQIVPKNLVELTERYRELDVPALLIWGRHDRVVPLWVGERLSRELPNAYLAILERCGHIPPEELPEESYEPVEAFLDGDLSAP